MSSWQTSSDHWFSLVRVPIFRFHFQRFSPLPLGLPLFLSFLLSYGFPPQEDGPAEVATDDEAGAIQPAEGEGGEEGYSGERPRILAAVGSAVSVYTCNMLLVNADFVSRQTPPHVLVRKSTAISHSLLPRLRPRLWTELA